MSIRPMPKIKPPKLAANAKMANASWRLARRMAIRQKSKTVKPRPTSPNIVMSYPLRDSLFRPIPITISRSILHSPVDTLFYQAESNMYQIAGRSNAQFPVFYLKAEHMYVVNRLIGPHKYTFPQSRRLQRKVFGFISG